MKDIPKKLEKFIASFDDNKRKEKIELFLSLYERATNAGLQSPRHWAMRQVLSEKSTNDIEKRFIKLARNKKSE